MSNSASSIEHGYLVLADISGYTSFLVQTELDHAQEILSDLPGEEIVRSPYRTAGKPPAMPATPTK